MGGHSNDSWAWAEALGPPTRLIYVYSQRTPARCPGNDVPLFSRHSPGPALGRGSADLQDRYDCHATASAYSRSSSTFSDHSTLSTRGELPHTSSSGTGFSCTPKAAMGPPRSEDPWGEPRVRFNRTTRASRWSSVPAGLIPTRPGCLARECLCVPAPHSQCAYAAERTAYRLTRSTCKMRTC